MTDRFTDFMTFLPLIGGMAGFAGVGVIAMKIGSYRSRSCKREENVIERAS